MLREPPCIRQNPFAIAGARHDTPTRVSPLQRGTGRPRSNPMARRNRRTSRPSGDRGALTTGAGSAIGSASGSGIGSGVGSGAMRGAGCGAISLTTSRTATDGAGCTRRNASATRKASDTRLTPSSVMQFTRTHNCSNVLVLSQGDSGKVTHMPRRIFVLLLLASAGFAATKAPLSPARMAASITIYRDTYGVPHIYGPTDASCVFGYAYAQAEDNFWQVEDSFIRSLGRASEVYGERALADDKLVRALEIPRLSKA